MNTNRVPLSGNGWIDVKDIEVNGVPYAIQWTTTTNWTVNVTLASGTNFLTVQGVDRSNNRRPDLQDSISITRSHRF